MCAADLCTLRVPPPSVDAFSTPSFSLFPALFAKGEAAPADEPSRSSTRAAEHNDTTEPVLWMIWGPARGVR